MTTDDSETERGGSRSALIINYAQNSGAERTATVTITTQGEAGAAITVTLSITQYSTTSTITITRDILLDGTADITAEILNAKRIEGNLTIRRGTAASGSSIRNADIAAFAVDTITGDLTISDTELLRDLDAFNSLRHIGGYLRIAENDELTTINGFDALESIGGRLYIGQ